MCINYIVYSTLVIVNSLCEIVDAGKNEVSIEIVSIYGFENGVVDVLRDFIHIYRWAIKNSGDDISCDIYGDLTDPIIAIQHESSKYCSWGVWCVMKAFKCVNQGRVCELRIIICNLFLNVGH